MGYQFDDVNAAIPTTAHEIDAEIAGLVSDMAEIDVQFVFYKTAPEGSRDATWHGRALAAKGHMMRRVRALKVAKAALLEDARASAVRARQAAKAERDRLAAEKYANVQIKWKHKFHALQQWVWATFPEHRDALIAEMARLKND